MNLEKVKNISSNRDIRGGTPVLEGTRVPISLILAEIAEGHTIQEIADDMNLDAERVKGALLDLASLIAKPVLY